MLSITNFIFDIFGLEYALPLLSGGKVVLSTLNEITLNEINSCNTIQQTPHTLLNLSNIFSNHLSDKICIVGGERLNAKL